MSQIEKTMRHGPLDGHKVMVNKNTPAVCFATGDVYARNNDGEYVYSEWQTKAMKIEINEMLAGQKRKRSGRR